MPLAARRPQGPESLRLKHALPVIARVPAGVAGRRRAAGREVRRPSAARSRARAADRRASPTCASRPARPSCGRPNTRWRRRKRPPTANARGSLGALRFADLHVDLGAARTGQGDFAGAAAGVSQRARVPAARRADPRGARRRAVRRARLRRRARGHQRVARDRSARGECQSPGGQHRLRRRALGRRHRALPLRRRQRSGPRAGRIRPAHVLAGADARRRRQARVRRAHARRRLAAAAAALHARRVHRSRAHRSRSAKATTTTTRSPTPAPTSGCARRCSTSARRTGRAASPTWRATISRRW